MKRVGGFGGALLAAGLCLVGGAVGAGVPVGAGVGSVHAVPGYLGIDVRDVTEDQLSVLRLKDTRGAEIIRVDHDGPAGKMGLREHDVVLQMNGVVLEGQDQMRRMLRECLPGRTVALVISRDGQILTVTAQMADRNQVEKQAWADHLGGPQAPSQGLPTGVEMTASGAGPGPAAAGSRYSRSFLGTLLMSPSYTGAMLETMGPQLAQFFGSANGKGLLVRSIEGNSPAALAGMQAGDVVVKANAQMVGTPGDWAKLIKEAKGRPVVVVVLRDRTEHTLTLVPDGKRRSSLELPPRPGAGGRLAI